MEAAAPHQLGLAAARLREEVQGRLGTGPAAAPAARESSNSRLRGGDPTSNSRYARKIRQGAASTGKTDPRSQVRALLAPHLPAHLLDPVSESVLDYLGTAPSVLNAFASYLSATGNPQLLQVAAALDQYLREPNDLLPDHLGVLGLLDDAWLIHNTVASCIAMGVTSAWDYGIDWNRITQANGVVEMLLPPNVKQTLAGAASQLLQQVQTAAQAWCGFSTGGYGVGSGYEQGTEELRDELAPHVGGLMLKYGV